MDLRSIIYARVASVVIRKDINSNRLVVIVAIVPRRWRFRNAPHRHGRPANDCLPF